MQGPKLGGLSHGYAQYEPRYQLTRKLSKFDTVVCLHFSSSIYDIATSDQNEISVRHVPALLAEQMQ